MPYVSEWKTVPALRYRSRWVGDRLVHTSDFDYQSKLVTTYKDPPLNITPEMATAIVDAARAGWNAICWGWNAISGKVSSFYKTV